MVRNAKNSVGKQAPSAGKPFKSWTWVVGYRDALANVGFSRDYDKWSRLEQHSYEIGRLVAVNIRTAGIKPPKLVVNKTKAYIQAYNEANERIGHAHIVAGHVDANQAFEETVKVY